ncbi:MAG: transcriptional repressor LexA [Candidatus Abyssubacteria bacterium]
MASLTKRQKQVLDFLRSYLAENGYAPSLAEIGSALGVSSVATVHKHLARLVEKGFVRHEPNQKRSVEVVDEGTHEAGAVVLLPLVGTIAAGEPIEAVEQKESIAVPSDLIPHRGRRMFVLRVKGNSMIDDHILDGDYAIVVEGHTAENGQTVVALLDGENATLKKFYREKDSIRLQPANEAHKPLILKDRDIRIQGILVGLLRRY